MAPSDKKPGPPGPTARDDEPAPLLTTDPTPPVPIVTPSILPSPLPSPVSPISPLPGEPGDEPSVNRSRSGISTAAARSIDERALARVYELFKSEGSEYAERLEKGLLDLERIDDPRQ